MNVKTAVIALVLIGAGLLAGYELARTRGGHGGGQEGGLGFIAGPPVNLTATIAVDGGGNCQQTVNGVLTGFPWIRPQFAAFGGDTIQWVGQDAAGNLADIEVDFPQNGIGRPGSPFWNGANPKLQFTTNQPSGAASNATLGDFYFSKVVITPRGGGGNPQTCQNPLQGMGVHVQD